MGLESVTYINDLVATNPTGGDDRSTSDDHHRIIKAAILATFANITGAVTASHTELNYSVGVTSAVQTQIDGKEASGVAAALVDDLSGVSDAATARTNLGLGALAVLATVDTAQIDALAVEAAQIAADAVTAVKILDAILTEAKFIVPTTGSSYRHGQQSAEVSTSATNLTSTGYSIVVPRTGVYQLSYQLRSDTGYTAYGRVYKNASTAYSGDVAIGTEQSRTTASYAEKVEASISLNAGDVVTLYHRANNGSAVIDTKDFTLESAVKPFGS